MSYARLREYIRYPQQIWRICIFEQFALWRANRSFHISNLLANLFVVYSIRFGLRYARHSVLSIQY